MDMRSLTYRELEAVKEYDRKHHGGYPYRMNRTRFYKVLTANGADVEIRVVAVKGGMKADDRYTLYTKEVVRASVDTTRLYVCDMAFHGLANYLVDWSREGLGHIYEWSCYKPDQWFGQAYTASAGMWKLSSAPVINPELLQETERFRYCNYSEACGEILDFLKVYAAHPRIELLVKAGLPRLAAKASIVSAMEKDKNLMRFVMDNRNDIAKIGYGVDVIRMAYKRGMTLHEANSRTNERRLFRGSHLPREIDATKANAYLRTQLSKKYVSRWSYCAYLKNCKEIGLDLADTKVSFPKQFDVRQKAVLEQVEANLRRKRKEMAKEMDKKLARKAATLAQLEALRGSLLVVLPKCDEDFIFEGKKLDHCVGDGRYSQRMARGESVIAFIRSARRPRVPLATVEFIVKTRTISQCYGLHSEKPEKRVLDFVMGRFQQAAARCVIRNRKEFAI